MLKTLRKRLATINTEIRAINDAAEAENRSDLTEEETARYEALCAERSDKEARLAQLEDEETRRAADAEARANLGDDDEPDDIEPRARVISEPTVYGRAAGNSYYLDLVRMQVNGDSGARTRLERHAKELDVDIPARRKAGKSTDFEKRVNPNRTDGQGGFYVPPLWLIDENIPFLRAGRTAADLCTKMDLPGGTDSINLPKLLTGTSTATQTDGGAVSSTDLTDTSVTAPVRTIAGQQDIAMQLLDQSPIAFDEIVTKDLMGDYNRTLDTQILIGSGAGNQLKGLVNASPNAITYTDASPTVPELYLPLAQAQSQVARQRFAPPTAWLLHPTRWYWILSALDSQNRPLVLPGAMSPYNPIGEDEKAAEGYAGILAGLPAYIDANIPTTVGGNQDVIYGSKWDDLYLFEGSARTRVLPEVLSGTLQVRIQLWNYVAFLPDRYAVATSAINGTGLAAPAGF
jgi:HK97 family phage major capsid protein